MNRRDKRVGAIVVLLVACIGCGVLFIVTKPEASMSETGKELLSSPIQIQGRTMEVPICGLPLESENSFPLQPVDDNVSYKIYNQTYIDADDGENRAVKIVYPFIISSEEVNFSGVNEAIKNRALNDYDSRWEMVGLNLEQDYTITLLTDTQLSIIFQSTPYVVGTAHPMDICHAITIDLVSGLEQSLSEVIPSYDDIREHIFNGQYSVQGSLSVYTNDDLWEQIQQLYACEDIGDHYDDFFLEPGGTLCLILRGLGHGAGDYSIVRLGTVH